MVTFQADLGPTDDQEPLHDQGSLTIIIIILLLPVRTLVSTKLHSLATFDNSCNDPLSYVDGRREFDKFCPLFNIIIMSPKLQILPVLRALQ